MKKITSNQFNHGLTVHRDGVAIVDASACQWHDDLSVSIYGDGQRFEARFTLPRCGEAVREPLALRPTDVIERGEPWETTVAQKWAAGGHIKGELERLKWKDVNFKQKTSFHTRDD